MDIICISYPKHYDAYHNLNIWHRPDVH